MTILLYKRFILAAVGLVVLLAVVGCGRDAGSDGSAGKEVRAETIALVKTEIPVTITATGSLHASKTVHVSTRMMGWVRTIHVTEGRWVKKGEPLISIDDTDLRAKKAQAEAGIREARAVLSNAESLAERFDRLYSDNSVSEQQLNDVLTGRDRARAGVAMAEAALAEVKVHMSYLEITAPVDGLVSRKMTEEGDMASPGMPLMVLEQAGNMKVIAHLGEMNIDRVALGAPLTVDVTSLPGATYQATLNKVVPAANPGSRTYDIEAAIANADGRLKSGMFARVQVPVGLRPAIVVPEAAVIRRGQLSGVWLTGSDGIVQLRWIRLGQPTTGGLEVLSGLSGGETLVLNPEQPLTEGDRVVN